ncbi:class I adenylate-forming enzyme family protein [Sporomusa acidovorans]|uniref:Long-chain-fatty-acid--CoA ligase n=1 Tax=Sporomusa acidovorans (strain ATCC 49682 / DSM 3132 / Mol) TaxID=1123286 RepID=A0ABZ3J2X8_SPOA4|nr:class I adenylate-forming enzyme family protein [Sporomusa acidovorans]OZC19983.1 long-chain-fatty-acid--CoA ligase [Sporomusa acidovorans DSM 3132]SDD48392.1 Acyl-CoA synthetase (AMP-forming)/AMP-acid ligase II [Sporomusa acidovorans]
MLITEILSQNARLYGDDISLVEINPELQERQIVPWSEYELIEPNPAAGFRQEITWREFEEKANKFANLLMNSGIRKGDKVAILLMNCLEWLPIYFGILKTGALAVPLNFRYTTEEIKYCLELAEVTALVFGPEFIERVEPINDKISGIKLHFFVGESCPSFAQNYKQLVSVCSDEAPQIPITEEDDAAIYFSSGTTGFPKAILHSQRSLVSACYTEQNHHRQTRGDNFLCIPPLYHTGAKMHWFGSLLVGGKAVLLRGVKPKWILKAVSEEKITIVWLLVPWVQDILDAISSGEVDLNDYNLQQWRLMHIGAQPVPPSLIQRWKKYFPNHLYDTNYGLSESIGPGCVHLGMDNIHKVGAIGKQGYNWEAMIIDGDGHLVPQGHVGELIVKGPGVMKCYYRDPEATAAVLKDGWLLTGDMARMDKDGFIYLVDRKKDVIISGGENLYPVQIEDFLHRYDAIKDVAVIGLPDQRLGEIAAAIIELKPDCLCSEREIREFCSSLPRYKRPRRIIFDVVPRNPTGKIEKPKLRKKFCASNLVAVQTQN